VARTAVLEDIDNPDLQLSEYSKQDCKIRSPNSYFGLFIIENQHKAYAGYVFTCLRDIKNSQLSYKEGSIYQKQLKTYNAFYEWLNTLQGNTAKGMVPAFTSFDMTAFNTTALQDAAAMAIKEKLDHEIDPNSSIRGEDTCATLLISYSKIKPLIGEETSSRVIYLPWQYEDNGSYITLTSLRDDFDIPDLPADLAIMLNEYDSLQSAEETVEG
jgi:hypothetical protein